MTTTPPTLRVEDLRTHFATRAGPVRAVDGVSVAARRGEILGLVGESGSGKTVTGLSILGLVDPPGRIVGGRILFRGEDLVGAGEERLRRLRGSKIAMVFQDPVMALNPVLRIDTQMVEAVLAHHAVGRRAALGRARDALALAGMSSPDECLLAYPHQLSGGMRQRVAIATAFLNEPELVIADEPTTALDVTVQARILDEVRSLCRRTGAAMVWITHDLAVVAGLAERIAVMYAGRIVEQGPAEDVIERPAHPYTAGLLGSVPSANARGRRLSQIPGMAPSLLSPPEGCAFRPRCPRASTACLDAPPATAPEPGREVRCFHPLVGAAA